MFFTNCSYFVFNNYCHRIFYTESFTRGEHQKREYRLIKKRERERETGREVLRKDGKATCIASTAELSFYARQKDGRKKELTT